MERLLEGDDDARSRTPTPRSCGSPTSPSSTSRRAARSSPARPCFEPDDLRDHRRRLRRRDVRARQGLLPEHPEARAGTRPGHARRRPRATRIWETIANTADRAARQLLGRHRRGPQGHGRDAQSASRRDHHRPEVHQGLATARCRRCRSSSASAPRPSASPTLLAGTQRTSRPPSTSTPRTCARPGLLKDAITLYHPEETQPSDLTLLRAAARASSSATTASGAPTATRSRRRASRPVLVVQVEDAERQEGHQDRPRRGLEVARGRARPAQRRAASRTPSRRATPHRRRRDRASATSRRPTSRTTPTCASSSSSAA